MFRIDAEGGEFPVAVPERTLQDESIRGDGGQGRNLFCQEDRMPEGEQVERPGGRVTQVASIRAKMGVFW